MSDDRAGAGPYYYVIEARVIKPVPPDDQPNLDIGPLVEAVNAAGGTVLSLVEDEGFGWFALLPDLSHEQIGAIIGGWSGRFWTRLRIHPVCQVAAPGSDGTPA